VRYPICESRPQMSPLWHHYGAFEGRLPHGRAGRKKLVHPLADMSSVRPRRRDGDVHSDRTVLGTYHIFERLTVVFVGVGNRLL
jgi:hypothetical protein